MLFGLMLIHHSDVASIIECGQSKQAINAILSKFFEKVPDECDRYKMLIQALVAKGVELNSVVDELQLHKRLRMRDANANLRAVNEAQMALGSEREPSTSGQLQDPVAPSGTIGDIQGQPAQPAGGNGSILPDVDTDIPDNTAPSFQNAGGEYAILYGRTLDPENILIKSIVHKMTNSGIVLFFGLDLGVDKDDVDNYVNNNKPRVAAFRILKQFLGKKRMNKESSTTLKNALNARGLCVLVNDLQQQGLLLEADYSGNHTSVNARDEHMSQSSSQWQQHNVVPFGMSSEHQGQSAGGFGSLLTVVDTAKPDNNANIFQTQFGLERQNNADVNANLQAVKEQGCTDAQMTEPEHSTSGQLQDPVAPSGTIGDIQGQPAQLAGSNGSLLPDVDTDIPDNTAPSFQNADDGLGTEVQRPEPLALSPMDLNCNELFPELLNSDQLGDPLLSLTAQPDDCTAESAPDTPNTAVILNMLSEGDYKFE